MVVGIPPDPDKGKTGVDVRVAVFFDGTLNNRYNTTARIKQLGSATQLGGAGTSYENFYSNVAILESLNRKRLPTKKEVSVYVDGPGTNFSTSKKGTPEFESDSFKGYAYGSGDTGIPEKVSKGITKIREVVNSRGFYNHDTELIHELIIDVFGFSRGAAAARNFVARRGELKAWAAQRHPAIVTINFVGLFDTVSSYNPSISTSPNFDNDVQELGLRIGGNAKKVVHLTAGDEVRKNFASTTIDSSIGAGVGYECQLPGAHSDIGGGYVEEEVEERRFSSTARMEKLIHDGWYIRSPDQKRNQIFVHEERYESLSEPTITAHWLVGRRRVRHHYQFIPLAIMRTLALKSGLDFEDFTRRQYQQYEVPPELASAKSTLHKIAVDNDRAHRQVITFTTASPGPMVRNKYLHQSAVMLDLANDERRLLGGVVQRQPIIG